MQVFLSWSGDRSRQISLRLYDILPGLVRVKPWHSERDLGDDENWRGRLEQALDDSQFGIFCLTKDNQKKLWPGYEFGALRSKGLCALLFDLDPKDLEGGPFARLDLIPCNEDGLLRLAGLLNARSKEPVHERTLQYAARGAWLELRQEIESPVAAVGAEEVAGRREFDKLATADREDAPPAIYVPHGRRRDALIVVDIQNDFFEDGSLPAPDAESLLPPLNEAIAGAIAAGMTVVYAQDWHPLNHKSFGFYPGGEWPPHCVQYTAGAAFHPDLLERREVEVVRFGIDADKDGYSPYENPRMDAIINRTHIETVYVVGIALEYCVFETCIETLKRNKKVVAVESLIRAVYPDQARDVWATLKARGVHRIPSLTFKAAVPPYAPQRDVRGWPVRPPH
ncbi:MAG: isochorismatase family protein [Deltaproteobacteria bacterium]|nr:isochorismatase family protein [Deltaproteobacteria bacterium]